MHRFLRPTSCSSSKAVLSSRSAVQPYHQAALRLRRIGGKHSDHTCLSRVQCKRDALPPSSTRVQLTTLRNTQHNNRVDASLRSTLLHRLKEGESYLSKKSTLGILQRPINVSSLSKSTFYYSDIPSGSVALFDSSHARLAAPVFLAPLLVFLKSGTVVKTITIVNRVAISLVAPLKLGARRILVWWHGHEHIAQLRAQQLASTVLGGIGEKTGSHHWHRPHFHRTTVVLLAAPVVLLAVAVLASLERTPVWGRWRVIMMSADEEALLIDEFLAPGTPEGVGPSAPVKRDWLAILREASGEERGPPGTLCGLRVLDPASDWRARWVQDVFHRLEAGVDRASLTAECKENKVFSIDGHEFVLPPVKYPLTVRPAMIKHYSEDVPVDGPLVTHHGCLVVESPLRNAFSIGFGPALGSDASRYGEAPGVVVVYTGLLDEILSTASQEHKPQVKTAPAPASMFGIFQHPKEPPVSIGATKYHSDQLAVVLSHELGHLLLSHSLEAWASSNFYDLLGTLSTDLVRIILYPLTAFLGPVFNDWFGEQIKVTSALGLSLKNNCEHRKAEHEADLIGLRILLGAGIDPRIACEVWSETGVMQRAAQTEAALSGAASGSKEDDSWLARSGFTLTHPVNEERLVRIKDELAQWEKHQLTPSTAATTQS